jgi:iron complex outermembrane recepter protein
VAGYKFIRSASAAAALSLSSYAIAQQANTPASEEVDTVVVTGVRESLMKGLENKRESTQVIESIVAEDIGKLPDNNVIEALQRVTGVQITNRGGGEADGISIRGLPDSVTTWNGRSLFTSNGRALALQDVPSNLVNRIDVYKTRSADQLETGLAGQIDIRTHRPLDNEGFMASVNARYTLMDQRDSKDPSFSALVSNSWDLGGGRFGAMANVSYTKVRWRDQNITAGAMLPFATVDAPPQGFPTATRRCTDPANPPQNWGPLERIFPDDCRGSLAGEPLRPLWQAGTDRGLSWEPGSTLTIADQQYEYYLTRDALIATDGQGDRERPAANLALQWAPNENAEYTFEAFYQGYDETIFNNLFFTFVDGWWANGANPTVELFPDTNVIKSRRVGQPDGFQSGDAIAQYTDSYAYALNGKWRVGDKLTLNADLSLQDSKFVTNFIAMRLNAPRFTRDYVDVDFNAGGGVPSYHFNDDSHLLDPNFWVAAELFQNKGRSEGDAKTFQFDGDYAAADEGSEAWFQRLKFGVRLDERTSQQASPRPIGSANNGFPLFNTFDERWYHVNDNFMDGEADMPSSWLVPNGWYMANHRDELREIYGVETADPTLIEAFNVEERTTSAYVQADMRLGEKLDAQVGVRFVKVDSDMVFTDLNLADLPRFTADASVDEILPSLTLRYSVTDDFRLRFNYGETLRRPDFADLNPNFNLVEDLSGVGYGTGSGGNPNLAATKSKNFDFTAEWYFADDSAIYGTLFRRDIDGLVVRLARRQTIPNEELNTDEFVVTQPVNASDGELKGIELGIVWFPDLPGVLNGFGVQGSLTKLDSEQNIPFTNTAGDIVGQENSEFFGVSDMSYNVTLAYDNGGFDGRLSYVWRDDFLARNEARIFANPIGIWRAAETSLDLQLSYHVNDNLAVSFDAINLTEEMQQEYYKFADAGSPSVSNFSNVLFSRSFSLGVRWKY